MTDQIVGGTEGCDGKDQIENTDHLSDIVGKDLLCLSVHFHGVDLHIGNGASSVPAADHRITVNVLFRLKDRKDLVKDKQGLIVIEEDDTGIIL